MEIIVRVAAILFIWQPGLDGATIERVMLVGDTEDYISIHSTSSYTLKCQIRAGYDDPVRSVNWYKDGRLAYSWDDENSGSYAYGELIGKVETTGSADLKNLRFTTNKDFSLSGNYTCEVISEKETVKSTPYPLVVLDVASDDFQSQVTLLSNAEKEAITENENKNCTLLWDFHTPAIFPKPNVTCGYYSYLHDDVLNSVPSGLVMHMMPNGSWQAKFDHIHIGIAEIPRNERLGCAVSVPFTSFKKVIKFEDNFAIDHLIDTEGCPSMFLDPVYRLNMSVEGGQMTCRGELSPVFDGQPLSVKMRCLPDQVAIFINGSVSPSWSMEIMCDQDFVWRQRDVQGVVNITRDVPICVPSCSGVPMFSYLTSIFVLLLLRLY